MRLPVLTLLLFAGLPLAVPAAVGEREAGQLRSTLTPMGAERAGNASGSEAGDARRSKTSIKSLLSIQGEEV